jgi:hypothetical protein
MRQVEAMVESYSEIRRDSKKPGENISETEKGTAVFYASLPKSIAECCCSI